MQLVKQVKNGGVSCWSRSKKHPGLFVVASTNTSIENQQQEQNEAALELSIFSFDSSQEAYEPICIGSTYLEIAAQSITWSTFGEDTNRFIYGLICVGNVDGSLKIFDANQIIAAYKQNPNQLADQTGLVSDFKEFNVPVYTAEFNSYKPNLIAIGGDEVLVVDISKDLENPVIIAPGESNLHENSVITSVSWNKKVPHILASASSNGVAVVWNLKTNQVSFQIPDIYRQSAQDEQRQLSVAWNPEIPLQFAINYHDENKPELHIWDLREIRGPIAVLDKAHTRRVEYLSWSSADTSLILTAAADYRVVCWNVKTKEILSSTQFEAPISSIQWSDIPSLFTVVLADSSIHIYSTAVKSLAAYPPKWYIPIVGATFAPNNVLTSFSEKTGQELSSRSYGTKDEKNHTDYVRWFQELNSLFEDEDLIGFCEQKQKILHSDDTVEQDQWRLLKAVAIGSTKEILNAVGYAKAEIIKRAEDYTGKKHVNSSDDDDEPAANQRIQQQKNAAKVSKKKKSVEFTDINEEQADDFFNALTISHTQNNQSQSQQTQAAATIPVISGSANLKFPGEEERYQMETVSKNTNWNTGVERNIKDNLIVGNFEGAIDCAMKCGRVTEALLIAFTQDSSLFASTAEHYLLTQSDENFVKQIFGTLQRAKNPAAAGSTSITTASSDPNSRLLEGFTSLKNWRESAGLAVTSSRNMGEFQHIMNHLGKRYLDEKHDSNSAICCFILGQNFSGLAEIYQKSIDALKDSKQRAYYMLQSAMKLGFLSKLPFAGTSKTAPSGSPKFDSILLELAKIALENQLVVIAYRILTEANPRQQRVATMMDLLYNMHTELLQDSFARPPLPYKVTRIQVSISKNTNVINQKSTISHGAAGTATGTATQNQHINNAATAAAGTAKLPVGQNLRPTNPISDAQNNPNNRFGAPARTETDPFGNPIRPVGVAAPPVGGVNNSQVKQVAPPPVPANPVHAGVAKTINPIQNNNNTRTGGFDNAPPNLPPNPRQNVPLNNPPVVQPPVAYNQNNLIKTPNPPVNNNTFNNNNNNNNGVSGVRGPPPPNPNNKQITEQIGAKAIVPPRPAVIGQAARQPNPQEQQQQQQQQQQQYMQAEQAQYAPPPIRGGMQQNPPPPVVAKSNPVPPPPMVAQQHHHNHQVARGMDDSLNKSANSSFTQSKLSGPPPMGAGGAQKFPVGGNSGVNNNNNSNLPPPMVSPAPVQKAASSPAYTQDEVNLILRFVQDNLGIFSQVDPKKRDEHIAQMNQMFSLLQTNQLKAEQVKLLHETCQLALSGNQKGALNSYTNLSKIDFSTHKQWLNSLKRIIAQK